MHRPHLVPQFPLLLLPLTLSVPLVTGGSLRATLFLPPCLILSRLGNGEDWVPVLGAVGPPKTRAQAEVGQLYVAVTVNEDVVGFDVSEKREYGNNSLNDRL